MKNKKEKLVGFLLGILFLPVFAGKQLLEPKTLEDLVKEAEKNEMPNENENTEGYGGSTTVPGGSKH